MAIVLKSTGTLTGPSLGFYDPLSTALFAAGLKRMLATYSGPAIRVRRSSDNTEQDIAILSSGALDTASLLSFVGSGSGYVTRLYDQTVNARHAVQATASKQPIIVASGVLKQMGSTPAIQFPGSSQRLVAPFDLAPQSFMTTAAGQATAGYGSFGGNLQATSPFNGIATDLFGTSLSGGVGAYAEINQGSTPTNKDTPALGSVGAFVSLNQYNAVASTLIRTQIGAGAGTTAATTGVEYSSRASSYVVGAAADSDSGAGGLGALLTFYLTGYAVLPLDTQRAAAIPEFMGGLFGVA